MAYVEGYTDIFLWGICNFFLNEKCFHADISIMFQLWISEDFGKNWRMIGMLVKSYYWSEMTSPPTLYVEREEPSGLTSVVASLDLFRQVVGLSFMIILYAVMVNL